MGVYRRYRISYLVADARRRDRARFHTNPDDLVTTQWFRDTIKRQSGRCFYSGVQFDPQNPLLQVSIERLNTKIGYSKDNTIACLRGLNMARGEASIECLLQLLRRLKE